MKAEIFTSKEGNRKSVRCPDCKGVGEIDQDQLEGRVSVACPCGGHFYIKEGQIHIA